MIRQIYDKFHEFTHCTIYLILCLLPPNGFHEFISIPFSFTWGWLVRVFSLVNSGLLQNSITYHLSETSAQKRREILPPMFVQYKMIFDWLIFTFKRTLILIGYCSSHPLLRTWNLIRSGQNRSKSFCGELETHTMSKWITDHEEQGTRRAGLLHVKTMLAHFRVDCSSSRSVPVLSRLQRSERSDTGRGCEHLHF